VRLRSSISHYVAERRYAQLFGRRINATDIERVVAHSLAGLLDGRERPLRVLDMGPAVGTSPRSLLRRWTWSTRSNRIDATSGS
jgi:hypothetical protein